MLVMLWYDQQIIPRKFGMKTESVSLQIIMNTSFNFPHASINVLIPTN